MIKSTMMILLGKLESLQESNRGLGQQVSSLEMQVTALLKDLDDRKHRYCAPQPPLTCMLLICRVFEWLLLVLRKHLLLRHCRCHSQLLVARCQR